MSEHLTNSMERHMGLLRKNNGELKEHMELLCKNNRELKDGMRDLHLKVRALRRPTLQAN